MISERTGRFLSAVGGVLLLGGLFLTWYHVQRGGGAFDATTGWETFTRLRFVIVAGAIVLLLSAVVPQTQAVLLVRTLVGVVLGLLILRRIAFPPDIAAPVSSQFGVFVGLIGAVAAVFGGVVDSGREVVQLRPEMAFWRPPAAELGRGSDAAHEPRFAAGPDPAPGRPSGAVVDSTAEEIR